MTPAWLASRYVPALCSILAALAFYCVEAPAQAPAVSPVVQVAVNYAPGKSTMVSGFLVAEGRFVLTQASILNGAYDTAVALTNTDVLDPVLERVDERLNVAVLRLPGPVKASLSPASVLPAGEFSATIVGAPEAFETGRVSVRVIPGAGGLRWRIVPAIPPAFRGGPIVNEAGELLGIAVQESQGKAVVGIPVSELRALLPGLASTAVEKRAPAVTSVPQTVSPSSRIPAAESAPLAPQGPAPKPLPPAPQAQAPKPALEPTRTFEGPPTTPVTRAPDPRPQPPPASKPSPEPPAPVLKDLGRPLAAFSVKGLAPRMEARRPPEPARPAAAPSKPSVLVATGPASGAAKPAPVATISPPPTKPQSVTTAAPPVATPPPPRTTAPPATAAPTPGATTLTTLTPPPTPAPAPAPASPPSAAASSIEAWGARIQSEPQNVQLRLSYGDALISTGHYKRAVEILEKTRDEFPSEPRVYWHLAHAYWHQSLHKPDGSRRRSMERGAYRKALAAFETFLRMAPNDPRAPEARYRLRLLKQAQYGRR